MRTIELSGAGVAGAVLDSLSEIFECEIANRHCRRIGFDPYRRFRAVHRNLADAGENADALADLRIPIVVELTFSRRITRDSEKQDGLIVGICFSEGRIAR